MKRETAARLISTISSLEDKMNVILNIIREVSDEGEHAKIHKDLGEVFFYLNGIMRGAIKQYPDLDPD